MDDEAVIGMEVVKLGGLDDGSPHRMTVDCVVNGKVLRYQVTGHYNGFPDGPPERTVESMAREGGFTPEQAAELDALDRTYAAAVSPLMREHKRAQIRVLHGQDTLDWLDREERR